MRELPGLTPSTRAVQRQYEEHPYPVWEELALGPIDEETAANFLFAGCGTGRDLLGEAAARPHSRFLGIDLSNASLRFATFKAAEYGIANVRLKQHSILDVASLGETFDTIKCTGVLHHLEDPLAGLCALKSVLRPGGWIKFSVYSKAARRPILAAIELRKRLNPPPTDEGIAGFRDLILKLPADHPAKLVGSAIDFQTIAGTRDLLFNVLEHNFTVPDLVEMVERAGLRILRWGPPPAVAKFQAMGFIDPLDWRQWHEAEQRDNFLFSRSLYTLTVAP